MTSPALDVGAQVVERGLDVRLQIEPGHTVALLGANGSGKSTLLSVIAGLLTPDAGHVRLGGRVLTEVVPRGESSARRVRRQTPTHRRRVGLLAQEPLLFPHLTAAENVAFGPRSRRLDQPRRRAEQWLAAVNASDLATRRPAQLSGGQAQRVALARALAGEPELVLLDEPLAALDVSVAEDLRHLLARRLAGRTAVIVTHDLLDVLALADRVITLEHGRIVEDGPVAEVLGAPRSSFTARLAGINLLPGVLAGAGEGVAQVQVGPWRVSGVSHLDHAGSDELLADEWSDLDQPPDLGGSPDQPPDLDGSPDQGAPDGHGGLRDGRGGVRPVDREPVVALISPSALAVHLRGDDRPPTGSPRNAFAARVEDLQATPAGVRVRAVPVDPDDRGPSASVRSAGGGRPAAAASQAGISIAADITAASAADLGLGPGTPIWLTVKAQEVQVHPARR